MRIEPPGTTPAFDVQEGTHLLKRPILRMRWRVSGECRELGGFFSRGSRCYGQTGGLLQRGAWGSRSLTGGVYYFDWGGRGLRSLFTVHSHGVGTPHVRLPHRSQLRRHLSKSFWCRTAPVLKQLGPNDERRRCALLGGVALMARPLRDAKSKCGGTNNSAQAEPLGGVQFGSRPQPPRPEHRQNGPSPVAEVGGVWTGGGGGAPPPHRNSAPWAYPSCHGGWTPSNSSPPNAVCDIQKGPQVPKGKPPREAQALLRGHYT